jgi:hypothetical protein
MLTAVAGVVMAHAQGGVVAPEDGGMDITVTTAVKSAATLSAE